MIDSLLSYIEELGYGYFFFITLVGANLTPVPDPIYIMIAGNQAKQNLFNYIPAFLLTYLGMMTSLYVKFLFGRLFSAQALRLLQRPRLKNKMLKMEKAIDQYGNSAIIASYFLPGLRHIMPIFLGATGMRNARYITVSFSFGFIWTLCLFILGAVLDGSPSYVDFVDVGIGLIFICGIYIFYRKRKQRRKRLGHE
ncbi:VTT domain-containing protein [Bacillus sp. CGMCC 1.16541]|uniref:DedA family protein n=1 Tax=Bacillus sp. CGMCC 1.16541 TaxID=2185143 RepID=UPI000D733A86|nr:VTT domain-containing protein [Bacillus sp. CGMCC 1.16541]